MATADLTPKHNATSVCQHIQYQESTMSIPPEKSTSTNIFGASLFFLGAAPSLWLINVIISWFGHSSVGVAYIGVFLAVFTLPIGVILLLWFIFRPTRLREKILWKKMLANSCAGLLIENAIFLVLFWNSYHGDDFNQWH
jgi:hypothetical protein